MVYLQALTIPMRREITENLHPWDGCSREVGSLGPAPACQAAVLTVLLEGQKRLDPVPAMQ